MAHRCLKSPRSLSGKSADPIMVDWSISWSWMDESHCFRSMSIGCPIPAEIRLFQTLTSKLQGQGHGHRARSYSWPCTILLIRFLFISNQSDQKFWFQNLPLKLLRSRSWVRSKVKVTYYTQYPTDASIFISHQWDQPFLRYGQNSVWLWKNTSEIFKESLPK